MTLQLRKMVDVNSKVHAARYNSLIAGESAGLVPSRVRLSDGVPAPLGFRLMTVRETKDRFEELSGGVLLNGKNAVRLQGGRLEPKIAITTSMEVSDATTVPTWEVVCWDVCGMAMTEALVLALSPDKITLAPGAPPPVGFRLMRADEAASARWKYPLVKNWLEEWSTTRLEGGKIDGSGYGGVVTLGDFTDAEYIGEALVVPLETI
jgi:hypothetical protein